MYNQNFTVQTIENAKKVQEKKQIRSSAMYIGFAMLITMAVSILWGTVYLSIMGSLGIDSETARRWASDPAVIYLINAILSALMFTFPFLLVLWGGTQKFHEIVSLSKPDKRFMVPIILISVAFCSFANIAGSVIISLLSAFGIRVPNPMPQEPSGILGMIIVFVGAAVVAPICEEFAMRGIVMGSLRKYGDGLAIYVSAILFGLMHGNMMQIPFAFIVGLALGFAVIKTGSLWTGIIIHAINNGIATVLDWATKGLSAELQSLVSIIYFVACMLCAFVGVYLLKGKSKEATELEKTDMTLSEKQLGKAFFASPVIIIYIALIVIETIAALE